MDFLSVIIITIIYEQSSSVNNIYFIFSLVQFKMKSLIMINYPHLNSAWSSKQLSLRFNCKVVSLINNYNYMLIITVVQKYLYTLNCDWQEYYPIAIVSCIHIRSVWIRSISGYSNGNLQMIRRRGRNAVNINKPRKSKWPPKHRIMYSKDITLK